EVGYARWYEDVNARSTLFLAGAAALTIGAGSLFLASTGDTDVSSHVLDKVTGAVGLVLASTVVVHARAARASAVHRTCSISVRSATTSCVSSRRGISEAGSSGCEVSRRLDVLGRPRSFYAAWGTLSDDERRRLVALTSFGGGRIVMVAKKRTATAYRAVAEELATRAPNRRVVAVLRAPYAGFIDI